MGGEVFDYVATVVVFFGNRFIREKRHAQLLPGSMFNVLFFVFSRLVDDKDDSTCYAH